MTNELGSGGGALGGGGGSGSGGGGLLTLSKMDDSLVGGVQGYWRFDGDLTDSSGNGLDLTAVENPVLFKTTEGLEAVWLRFAQQFQRPGNDAVLTITGPLTLHVLAWVETADPQADAAFVKFGGGGETEATNFLYDFGLDALAGQIRYFAEEGAGNNIEDLIEAGAISGKWTLYSLTRDAGGDITYYLDGEAIATASLASPTGGTSGFLQIENINAWLAGLIVADEESTPAEVLALAQQVGVAA